MALDFQAEHRPAKHHRIIQLVLCARHVLDYKWAAGIDQHFSSRLYQIGMLRSMLARRQLRIRLARRAGPNEVEVRQVERRIERVGLREQIAAISRLRFYVHTRYMESRLLY